MKNPLSSSTQAISLSPKLSSTFSEGFANQYNSPKTITAKGFIMSRTPYDNPSLVPRPQKRDNSYGQTKSKPTKATNSSALESSTPTQKTLASSALLGYQISDTKTEKRSSSKQKCETLRTVSSSPKNGLLFKTSESVRREDTSYNANQYKWKKLEISTDFANTKSAMTNKAQTTKQQPPQSASKISQGKKDNSYTFYTEQNDENRTKEQVEGQHRGNRPLSSYDNNPKTVSTSLSQGQGKVRGASERDNSASKTSYRKDKPSNATPKAQAGFDDLRASGYGNDAGKRKERPLSAKQGNKEEKQAERGSSKEPQKNAPQASLQSFVTKVNKGEAFGSIKKYGEKRDSSARRTQKPQLNLDERKPIRAVDLDLKGPKTTPNVESKVFTISLGKSSVSPTAASSQSLVAKNKKATTKEAQKAEEAVLRAKIQGKESFIYYMTHLERAHRWNGDADYFVQLYQEHFLQTYQALSFIKNLRTTDPSVLAQKRVNLPRRETHKDKRTLVFDMDETLIHCNESLDMPADVVLPIIFPNGEVVEAGINIRPYAIEILRELSQHFEIMVFTASHSCYANVVLDYLDPHEEFIHHRLFRESCVVTDEGLHVKDLRVIGNRNLQDLILVDNAAYSFGFQVENGIPIIPFYDNKADQELRHLIPYLKFLSTVKDLREVNKQTFKLHHYAAFEEAEELLEKVILQG